MQVDNVLGGKFIEDVAICNFAILTYVLSQEIAIAKQSDDIDCCVLCPVASWFAIRHVGVMGFCFFYLVS